MKKLSRLIEAVGELAELLGALGLVFWILFYCLSILVFAVAIFESLVPMGLCRGLTDRLLNICVLPVFNIPLFIVVFAGLSILLILIGIVDWIFGEIKRKRDKADRHIYRE